MSETNNLLPPYLCKGSEDNRCVAVVVACDVGGRAVPGLDLYIVPITGEPEERSKTSDVADPLLECTPNALLCCPSNPSELCGTVLTVEPVDSQPSATETHQRMSPSLLAARRACLTIVNCKTSHRRCRPFRPARGNRS